MSSGTKCNRAVAAVSPPGGRRGRSDQLCVLLHASLIVKRDELGIPRWVTTLFILRSGIADEIVVLGWLRSMHGINSGSRLY